MQKKNRYLTLLILLFLILSACSGDQTTSPNLIEISSEEENEDSEEENEDSEEENEVQFIPPELPNLPDPNLSSSRWNQVNGPFGGTITSIFKSPDGYWVTTTDNSGLSDSNLYLVDNKEFTWELKKTISGNMGGVVVNASNSNQIAFYTESTSNSDSGVFVSKDLFHVSILSCIEQLL